MPSRLPSGIGLRYAPEHFSRLRSAKLPSVDFLEVDAEALMTDGGPHLRRLEVLRGQYRLSLHGAGLAIGAAERLDTDHLRRLALIAGRLRPASVSEHLAWSSPGVIDPIASRLEPNDGRTLARTAAQVDAVQSRLGRPILIETPLVCADLPGSTYDEGGFLDALAARTGCGILLDLANLAFSAQVRQADLVRTLATLPLARIAEVHLPSAWFRLAGCPSAARAQVIDLERLWGIYALLLHQAGRLPTLLDWEEPAPAFPRLLAEAERAARVMIAATGAHDERHA
jgi:uncharacterized protein